MEIGNVPNMGRGAFCNFEVYNKSNPQLFASEKQDVLFYGMPFCVSIFFITRGDIFLCVRFLSRVRNFYHG